MWNRLPDDVALDLSLNIIVLEDELTINVDGFAIF